MNANPIADIPGRLRQRRHGEGGGTRFIPFPDVRLLAGAFMAGALVAGLILGKRWRN